tara:strand:+ start:1473 stop:2168 length:696 start_codon:yes stop_codon:yes gene_type:complete
MGINVVKINELKYYPLFLQVDNMVSLYVEGEPVTPFEFIVDANQLLLLPGLVILFVIWLFFQAADPENKRIQNERAPTIIELAWATPLILISIVSGGFLFVPALFAMLLLRMYLVKLYQLFNPDWRTDETSVGVPAVERLGEALNNLPSKDEIAEDIANHLLHEYRDEGTSLRRLLRAPPIGTVIEFHKKNHKKRWFVIYVYFLIVPFLIVLLLLSYIVAELIDGVFASII